MGHKQKVEQGPPPPWENLTIVLPGGAGTIEQRMLPQGNLMVTRVRANDEAGQYMGVAIDPERDGDFNGPKDVSMSIYPDRIQYQLGKALVTKEMPDALMQYKDLSVEELGQMALAQVAAHFPKPAIEPGRQ